MSTRELNLMSKPGKSITVVRECKIHGETDHYYYQGHSVTMCKACAKEKRKAALQDPEKRRTELVYAKKWQDENKDRIKAHYLASQKLKHQIKTEKIDQFLATEAKYIKYILGKYDIKMTNVLRNHIGRVEQPNMNDFLAIVRKQKFSELKAFYTWNQSSKLKYEFDVRPKKKITDPDYVKSIHSYDAIVPEHIKDMIAAESKEFGVAEANRIMKILDQGLPVNKAIGKK